MNAVIKYYEAFKPELKRQPDGRYTFYRIPIFSTHERNDETPMDVTPEWMRQCVQDQKELKRRFNRLPKVTKGHNPTDLGDKEKPAEFLMDNYSFDPKNGWLYADWVDVPPKTKDEILANKWPGRSCEPSATTPRIESMALLGGRPGWLKNLPDIHYADKTAQFKEIVMAKPATTKKYAELAPELKDAITSAVKEALDGLVAELGAQGAVGQGEPYAEETDEERQAREDRERNKDAEGETDEDRLARESKEEADRLAAEKAGRKYAPTPDGGNADGTRHEGETEEERKERAQMCEGLIQHAESQYASMSTPQLKAMWAKVSSAGGKRSKKTGEYDNSDMEGAWPKGKKAHHAEGDDRHYAELTAQLATARGETSALRRRLDDTDRARERANWTARYAELQLPAGRIDVSKHVDHLMRLPANLRQEHFDMTVDTIGTPSTEMINQGKAFATYSESLGVKPGPIADEAAFKKFLQANRSRFGGDTVAAARAFEAENSED